MPYLRYFLISFILLLAGYFSWRTYLYYSDTTTPELGIVGISEGGYYSGNMTVNIKGSSPYKIAAVSVWLDDVLVQSNVKVNRKSFDHQTVLHSADMVDGRHVIKVETIDATKHQNKNSIEKIFYVDNKDLQAVLTLSHQDYKVPQGRCLHVQFQANKSMIEASVKVFSGSYVCFPRSKNSLNFEAFIPVECDQIPQEYSFVVEIKDHVGHSLLLEDKFQVTAVQFKKKILHVQSNRLKSELEFTPLQERDLEEGLERLSKNSIKEKLWYGSFDVPILMTGISTEFGVIRTSQERGRTVHKALDIVADPKSVIWASNNGVVVLKDRFTHSGNTIVIDHGYGILSLYYHLQDFADVEVGQKVKKGNPLGHMGMTGFANGPHLHWEIRVNNVAVDPMQWTQLIG